MPRWGGEGRLGAFEEEASLWCPFCGSELIQMDGGRTGHPLTPAPCQQLQGMPRTPSCPVLCSRNLLSSRSQTGAGQRYWGQCHPMSSLVPDFSVSVPVSNILPHSSMSYQNISVISLFLYPILHFHPKAMQKSCRPCARIWGMENVYFMKSD